MRALSFVVARTAALRNARAAQFVSDLLRYGLVSAAALGLDWSLLISLTRGGMNYLPAAAASFCAGMVIAYLGSVVFVYRGRRSYPALAEAAGFFLIGIAGLLVNILLLFVFVKFVGLDVGFAKAPTAVGVFLFNFLMRRMLLFVGAPMILPNDAPAARY